MIENFLLRAHNMLLACLLLQIFHNQMPLVYFLEKKREKERNIFIAYAANIHEINKFDIKKRNEGRRTTKEMY